MKKILAFSGSNSSTSINTQLLGYVTGQIQGHQVNTFPLVDYDLPMYSADLERESGIPVNARIINHQIAAHTALVIAVNEHNGNVSAYFKNILDWLSRLDRNFLEGKQIMLISTSPGARGAASALEYTKKILPRFGGQVVESFSLPSFKDNFQDGKVVSEVLAMGIQDVLVAFSQQVEEQDV